MMHPYAIKKQLEALERLFRVGAVEINGQIETMPLTTSLTGHRLSVLIHVPKEEIGTITKRIVKDDLGIVVWEDNVNIVKGQMEIAIEIPIDVQWKVVL